MFDKENFNKTYSLIILITYLLKKWHAQACKWHGKNMKIHVKFLTKLMKFTKLNIFDMVETHVNHGF